MHCEMGWLQQGRGKKGGNSGEVGKCCMKDVPEEGN